jgi:hypothetical protein
MNKTISFDLSDLYISGTSSPVKSPPTKTVSNLIKKPNEINVAPKSEIEIYSKWYIRGHKFTTIFNSKSPKPKPQIALNGFTHKQSELKPGKALLLLSQHDRIRTKSTVTSNNINKKNYPTVLIKKTSSKSFQVNDRELSSWVEVQTE